MERIKNFLRYRQYPTIFALIVVFFVVFFSVFLQLIHVPWEEDGAIGASIAICMALLFIPVAWLLGSIEKVGPYALTLDSSGQIKEIFEKEIRFWSWDQRIKGLVSYGQRNFSCSMEVSPITENPKVRRLNYRVQLEASGTPDAFLQLKKFLANLKERGFENIENWIEFQLYEFQEKSSQELGKLYNPLKKAQQQTLLELLREFFQPLLKGTDITVSSTRFSMP